MFFLFFVVFVTCWACARHGRTTMMIACMIALMFIGLALGRGADDPLFVTMAKETLIFAAIAICGRVYYVRVFTRKGVK